MEGTFVYVGRQRGKEALLTEIWNPREHIIDETKLFRWQMESLALMNVMNLGKSKENWERDIEGDWGSFNRCLIIWVQTRVSLLPWMMHEKGLIGCLRNGGVKKEPLWRSCLDSQEVRTKHCQASGSSWHLTARLCGGLGPVGLATF